MLCAFQIPPVAGQLLAGGLQEVASRARNNVARYRAFDVDAHGRLEVLHWLPNLIRIPAKTNPGNVVQVTECHYARKAWLRKEYGIGPGRKEEVND